VLAYSAAHPPLGKGPSFRLVCRSVSGRPETQWANAQLPFQGVALAYSAAGPPLCQGPSFRLVCRSVSGRPDTKEANAQLPFQGVVLAYPVAGLLLCQELTFHPTCQTDFYLTPKSLTQESPPVKHKLT
jgi:hypothetical protein